MAATAQTLILNAVGLGSASLSDRHVLMCICGFYGGLMGINAQQAISGAASLGYPALSDQALLECMVAQLQ